MKDDYGSEYLATNYEFLAIGCWLISNMYNFSGQAVPSPDTEIPRHWKEQKDNRGEEHHHTLFFYFNSRKF